MKTVDLLATITSLEEDLSTRCQAMKILLKNLYTSYMQLDEQKLAYHYIDIRQYKTLNQETPEAATELLASLSIIPDSHMMQISSMAAMEIPTTEPNYTLYLRAYNCFIEYSILGSQIPDDETATFIALNNIRSKDLIPVAVHADTYIP